MEPMAGRPVEAIGAQDMTGRRGWLEHAETVSSFRQSVDSSLSITDRRRIVDQALVLFDENYVHLPHKAAMHAVDPVQRLRVLRARLDRANGSDDLPSATAFHREMSQIFHSVRDLHTNYLLPAPFATRVAVLPFLVEEYWDRDEQRRRYVVSHVVSGFDELRVGDEVAHWNGMTIDRAVDANAARHAGSNDAARHARGVESLTIRPLVVHLPPDEDWVVVGCGSGGDQREVRLPWLVVENLPPMTGGGPKVTDAETALAVDLDGDAASRARRLLFAPTSAVRDSSDREEPLPADLTVAPGADDEVATIMPARFRARTVVTASGAFGHVRIFTFDTDDPWAFVLEFVRLVEQLPTDGLVVDVRGNGGGHIWAAELLLQTLTPHRVTPEPVEFLASTTNLELCRAHDRGQGGIDLGPWVRSLDQAVDTGALHSRGIPITPPQAANLLGQRYHGPVVLVTDARCYSATDMFAAGFADHGIGSVLGVDTATGAGGANVWTHDLLRRLYPKDDSTPYELLPAGVGMRVSIRRTLRVGDAAGTPVEDLGVRPNRLHRLTRRDLTEGNIDLLTTAGEILAAQPARRLIARGEVDEGGVLNLTLDTENLDRVDVYVDGRPRVTADLPLDPPTVAVAGALGGVELRVDGFQGDELVAMRRLRLGPVRGSGWGVVPEEVGVPAEIVAQSAAVPEALRFLVRAPGASQDDIRRDASVAWDAECHVERLFAMDSTDPDPSLAEHVVVSVRVEGQNPSARRRRAFEMARTLARRTGYEVQPDLGATVYGRDEIEGDDTARLLGGGGGEPPLPGTEDPAWALKALRVPEVRGLPGGDAAGIVVGHPDTGYTEHVELDGGALDLDRDRDVLDGDDDAIDPLTRGFLGLWGNPGHGTSTSSVIVSRPADVVEGPAAAASLIPIRAITSVALVFDSNVARAVEYARRQQCDVISMSLGGIGFSSSLRAAIARAIEDGILVLAAAGNNVGFVVAPANYPDVIAVAATNIDDKPWSGSSRGPAVDISAPGESVHAAKATRGPNTLTARSSGTSYAVAQTAGVAAIWLAHHGPETLKSRYGPQNLQRVFRHLLVTTSRRPPGWDSSQYGAGIVDAHTLLGADLPDLHDVPALDTTLPEPVDRLAAMVPGLSTADVSAVLDSLLPDVAPQARSLYSAELAYLIGHDPSAQQEMAAQAASAVSPNVAPSGRFARLRALLPAAGPVLASVPRVRR